MVDVDDFDGEPRSVIVIGAGIIGLSTAWFLQERGIEVTVVDRIGPGAGASWGNAGWIAPSLTIPLNQPSVLAEGLRSLLKRNAPLHIPKTADAGLAMFLARFAANSRRSAYQRTVQANLALNEESLEAFDVLTGNGVDVPMTTSPITAVFENTAQAQRLLNELSRLEEAGQTMLMTGITGSALYEQVPLASSVAALGLNIHRQRHVDPGRFVRALSKSVVQRGGTVRELDVVDVVPSRRDVTVFTSRGDALTADAAVIATGAWLPRLAGRWINVPLRAGRGYSFTVPIERPMPSPIYLPAARVACTPYRGAMRVSGTMEFRDPDEPGAPERVQAIIQSVRPMLHGVRWGARSNVWVGSRPVTADGRPLIGQVAQGIYVAGGHGMWGFTHGPVTGRLLAEQISTGKEPQGLWEFNPLR
ncbi:amino acid dehydrogenase [Mycobacterium asiaticum]|uniref:Amino acid dehydrogenase n=1 Tax=Mycobacterium asiaticum TaxID=1790 RepID=A0A1A3NYS0_MYCAS|nr:FAD-dependent oxidoreductase [Mycobacterium asiaticum]OBK27086.1 amino acid dehydrogenase [Mycobacterium asiaticum]